MSYRREHIASYRSRHMTNHIDRVAVLLAERVVVGVVSAEGELRKVFHTVGLSEDAHSRIRRTLGVEHYQTLAS